jgi:1-phosphofructokinase
VLERLLDDEGFEVRAVPTAGGNGCQVEDRRSGDLTCLADVPPTSLDRHELDNLHNNFLAASLECGMAVLTGTPSPDVMNPEVYHRVAADLTALGVPVVADLSGEPLTAALEGGLAVLKVSDEDLVKSGRAESEDLSDVVPAVEELCDRVASLLVLTRGGDPALAWSEGRVLEVAAPSLEPLHHRGAGDSMTAGIAAALSCGAAVEDALRIGAAAGVVNVTRHGLATGRLETIEQIVDRVEVRAWDGNEG